MSFSNNRLEQIEDYLNGTMNAEEIKVFESQINENTELAEIVALNKKMRLQFSDFSWDFVKNDKENKKLNELESSLKSNAFKDQKQAIIDANELYFNKNNSKKTKSRHAKLYLALAVAAALILFFGIFFQDNSSTNQELYSHYNNWDDLPSFVSRSETNDTLLSIGENAFINKDYTLASESFDTYINNKRSANPTELLYLGISQLELENYNKALESFQKIIDSKFLDQSKGYWYMALTYLKMEDRDNTIKTLEKVVKSSKNFNFAKAETLLKKLKK